MPWLAIGRATRPLVDVVGASFAVAVVGALDATSPVDLDFTALYLGIVAVAAWRSVVPVIVVTSLSAWMTLIVLDLALTPTNVPEIVVWNGVGGLAIVLGSAFVVHQARIERDALRLAATHDALTGLPNRVLLRDRLEQAVVAAQRDQVSVAVLVFDLDGFKRVNDTLGHQAGDRVLCLTAARARDCIRAADTCARFGGDEFAVLLARTMPDGARRVAQALQRACAEPHVIDGATVSVAASIGVALSPQDGTTSEALMRVADARMYEAKAQRRAATQPT